MFPEAASALIDAERKADFEEEGAHFESSYFLTLLYLPPAEDVARAESWLYAGQAQGGVNAREILRGFVVRTDRLHQLLAGFMTERAGPDSAQLLPHLHSAWQSVQE